MLKKLTVLRNEQILLIILAVMIVAISVNNPAFCTAENFFDILRSASFIGICSIGFLVVLISGGVDISFTAIATVGQYLMGLLLVSSGRLPLPAGLLIPLILLVPLVAGGLLGALNALLINQLKVATIIVAIGTMNIYYASVQYFSGGTWLYSFPRWFTAFSQYRLFTFTNAEGTQYGLSILTVIWLLTAAAGFFLLRYTSLGRKIYALGGSLESARRVGIRINGVRLFIYIFLGVISGIGAIVYTLSSRTVAPNAMIGLEFNVLSAVVLGGASISGGKGSVVGTLLGVLLIAVLTNGLTMAKVPNYWHQAFIGLMLLISVAVTALRERSLSVRRGGGHAV